MHVCAGGFVLREPLFEATQSQGHCVEKEHNKRGVGWDRLQEVER